MSDLYEPDERDLLAPDTQAITELDIQLTSKAAVDRIASAIRGAAFEFDQDDLVTITTADALQITDADAYARGYELLAELGDIEKRISSWYARFDKPLNFLIQVVRTLKKPQTTQVTPVKASLSTRLGAWKEAQDERDRQRQRAEQAARDLAARAAQDARAAALERVAELERNQDIQESLRREADAVRTQEVQGPPVDLVQTAPKVPGHTRAYWKCEFDDIKALVTAYVEGRCFIPDEAFIDGLQGYMDDQATSLQENLSKAFPGTHAVRTSKAISRRR